MIEEPYPAIIVFGPTAVGKTSLLSTLFPGQIEVINADSMQVYRYLDIGTAKPGGRLRAALPHHLIDILDPHEQYNAGMFVHSADSLIPEVFSRGKIPILSGGTAFYFRNFIYGLPETPPGDPVVRESIRAGYEKNGIEPLFAELLEKDPETAARLSVSDTYRIIRALEVLKKTGRPLSSFRVMEKPRKKYHFLIIGVNRPREELYMRINRRVDEMFDAGLLSEIKKLIRRGYGKDDPAMRGIGYREFFSMRETGCATVENVKEQIKQASRKYAKRQITFFKRIDGVRWFHPEDLSAIRTEISGFLEMLPKRI